MTEYMAVALLLLAVILARYGECRLHSRNYGYLSVCGAEELIPQTMRRYYLLHLLVVPAAILEMLWLSSKPLNYNGYLIGYGLVLLGFGLKLWAIRTLGPLWTMRCLFVEGAPHIIRGPYKICKHPEYLARFIETLGLLLILDSRIVMIAYLIVCLRVSFEVMRVETRQLREIAGPEDLYPSVEN